MATGMGTILIAAALAQAAQPPQITGEASAQVLDADKAFWAAYNACDIDGMDQFLTEGLEFYHDKSGLMSGKAALDASLRDGLCKSGGPRVRREAIESSVHFYPLAGYGGILSGDHLFYVREPGKAEYLDGQARFTHVWLLADGKWRMSRILSYDHGPPRTAPGVITLSRAALSRYAGQYWAKNHNEVVTVTVGDTGLQLAVADLKLKLEPVSETSFVVPDRYLRFDFSPDGKAHAYKISVWEKGAVIDEATPAE